MPPSAGNTLYGADGSTHVLLKELGRGGEALAWSLGRNAAQVAKIYLPPSDAAKAEELRKKIEKLDPLCRRRSEALEKIAAWPITPLSERRGGVPAGFLMRRAEGSAIKQLYSIKDRLKTFPEAQFPFLLRTALNIARAFASVHDAGMVVGDVNHSNLWVSSQAIITLIDCDSFQITEAGRTYFCPTGTPEWTPPELQGVPLAGQRRTPQNDAFGLSMFVFYLLFLGRHPYQGAYDAKRQEMILEPEAIGRYQFPYALPEGSPEVHLPAFVPRMADYPAPIGQLFTRAFTREAVTRGRPSATEWIDALTSLSAALKSCRHNPSHQYFAGLSQCPWCRSEGVIGVSLFGIRLSAAVDRNFNLTAIWAQIGAVNASPDALDLDSLAALIALQVPSPEIAGFARQRRKLRLASTALLLLPSIVAVATLQPILAVLIIALLLAFAVSLWKRGNRNAEPYVLAFKTAEADWKMADLRFNAFSAAPATLAEERARLAATKAELEGLAPLKAARLLKLEAARRQKQLQHHLERFRIEDERIPGIGAKNILLLLVANIEDAWDIRAERITAIKGFGPVKRDALLQWRFEKELLFRFDASQPVDPRDLHALDLEFRQKADALQSRLSAGPEILAQTVAVWRAQRRVLAARLNAATLALAKATVNRVALNKRT